ncbi:MAG: hypothetical protein Q4G10_03490 [Bacteroidia bacterium]|nr:hypothetical protein [Bacteroidia bacterium]
MKRYLRYGFAAIVAAIGLIACDPDGKDPITPEIPQKPEEARLATATAESISGYTATWEADSKFIVGYSASGTAKTVEMSLTEGTGTSTGKFSYDLKGELPAPSYAIFLASMVDKAGTGISDCTLKWPTEQQYGDPSISKMPMWAKCDGLSNVNGPYKFQTLGGILRLSVTGTGSISKIRLISDQPLSGVFCMDGAGNIKFDEGSKSVYYNIDLQARGNINLSDKATEFYFSMPAGWYSGFTVDFGGEAGSSFSYEIKDLVEIARGKLTIVSIDDVKGYGAGKLLRVEAEHDITYDNIKSALIGMVPQLKTFTGIFDAAVKPFIASHTRISRIIYLTPDRDGHLIEASGLVACQYDKKPYDYNYQKIVSVQHGTCDIAKAPSYQDFYPEIAPAAIKGSPNIVVMADYLGYGASQTTDLQHPYLSKELTGSCCADMLAAAEEFIAVTGIDLSSDKIDLVGYSQGGAATMATLLELEKRGGYDSRINEVWAGAGPYDILGFFDCFKSKETYEKTGFVPYTFRGICYGEHLNLDYANIYNPSLIKKVDLETLFSTKQVNEWHSELGYSIKGILHPDFYEANYGGNADILALVAALDKNSIVNYSTPRNIGKAKFYHSVTDDTVPYSCSEALQKAWGFPEIINLKAKNNHLLGGVEFLLDYCGLGTMADIIIPLIN